MSVITTTQENEIVTHRISGKVTVEELVEYLQKYGKNWVGQPVLWEVTKANFGKISTEEWKTIPRKASFQAERRKGEKTALVASEDFPFGMLRMFEILAENENVGIHFRTFRDIVEAKAWLLSQD